MEGATTATIMAKKAMERAMAVAIQQRHQNYQQLRNNHSRS
jgi:hypothetical protein